MRFIFPLLLASALASQGQTILFKDTFDRPDNRNIDATLTGITDGTGLPLTADNVYSHGWLDPNARSPIYGVEDTVAANGGGVRILSNQLNLATGAGTANLFINHNFTNASILEAGGFSISLDVISYTQTQSGYGGAFAVGMSQAEAAGTADAAGGTSRMTGAFGTAIGDAVPAQSVSDFWVGIRGNNTLAWGGKGGTVGGVSSLPAKTGTISVKFSVTSFSAGSTVGYQVFLNGTSQGSGTFVWSGTNENFIGVDARDPSTLVYDNFFISTFQAPASVSLTASPGTVAPDNSAQPVTLTWSAAGIPAGATYQITSDKAVSYPGGSNTGSIANGTGTANAVVNGTLGTTNFTITLLNAASTAIATATAKVEQNQPPSTRPNVIVMLVDDMGWSDLGCYGSEIPTPNIDALAADGVRFRQFYNSARCSPTRCSLLSGLYPQQAAVNPAASLPDLRNDNNVTFAELLRADGYRTYMAGKWHLGNGVLLPENRGFQHVWRMSGGQANNTDQWQQNSYSQISLNNEIPFRDYTGTGKTFYQTDAIGDYAVDYINHSVQKNDGAPFAMYLAFGAPHFPIQAPPALADSAMATYARGWDVLRQERYNRQLATGVIDSRYPFPALGGTGPHGSEPVEAIPTWESVAPDRKADLTRRMALYSAMIRKIDENVGKVVSKLRDTGRLDNTVIFFLSDNGANLEGGIFGNTGSPPATGSALTNMGQPGVDDVIHYGGSWAHLSNTPLKLFKHFTHEGGIRAPMIVHWPAGFTTRNTWQETPAHLVDIVATIKDVTGAPYPVTFNNHPVLPLEGISLVPLLNQQSIAERPIFVEHESNRMIRKGKWKLVTEAFTAFDNEFTTNQKLLYDMDADPGEANNLAAQNPGKVIELTDEWNAWSTRVGLPAGRLMVPPAENITPPGTPSDLFVDSFNRPNTTDIDSSLVGISGSRASSISAPWFEGFEGSGTGDSIQITDGILQMATGVGMSENGLNHNFIGQDILDEGGFSVSVRILDINTDVTDTPNRFAGFGVGLNAAQAAGGNDISSASPPPIRGKATNPGTADAFVELDIDGNLKLWIHGALAATVPTGKTKGTLTASFAFNSFAAGSSVKVSAYLDGKRIDLDPSTSSLDRTFTWDQTDANYVALSTRASNYVQLDNFAVRKLPLSSALATEYSLAAGLRDTDASLTANPDGDRLDNFGEWAFGTSPSRADDELAATSLVLAKPDSDVFRFAFRRLTDFANAGVNYRYLVSEDLKNWHESAASEESATPLAASPGYEAATFTLSPAEVTGKQRLFVRISAEP